MFEASVVGDQWYNVEDFGDQTNDVKNQITKIDECFKELCYTLM